MKLFVIIIIFLSGCCLQARYELSGRQRALQAERQERTIRNHLLTDLFWGEVITKQEKLIGELEQKLIECNSIKDSNSK